ncbi:TonB-dependent receptor [uncultured Abyssibacter sp.]|uniref:TonB-dependent receptor n=1 Tax=uncultured Abyssibacter sp. TaxID=2320202 RepID=UPI0032B28309
MKHFSTRGVAVLALVFSTAAGAQTADQERPSEPESIETELDLIPVQPIDSPEQRSADEPPRQLEEMVVTAQKTEQTLQEVPVSVTAIDGGFIQASGSADLADVSLYVPNVRVDADDLGSPQVFIRGFGTNAFNPSFESSVGFVQDEIYFGRPGYFTEAMFDVDSVEVLRGPQGTLFGKNTVAGVFNVITKGPVSGAGVDGRVFYGEHGEHRVEAGVGGMFNEWVGGRLAVLDRAQDGELYNQLLQRDEEHLEQQAARLKFRVLPTYDIDSEITAVISDTEAAFWPFQLFNLDEDTRTYLEDFDPDIEDDPKNFINSAETPGWIEKGSRTIGWKTEWAHGPVGALDDLNSVLVLGGSRFYIDQLNELDISPANIGRLDNHEDHDQLSAEFRFDGAGPAPFGWGTGVEFVAGAFWFDSSYTLLARILAGEDLSSYVFTDDAFQLITGNGGASSPLTLLRGLGPALVPLLQNDFYQFDYTQDISSAALFGQMTWYLTERWAITPGIRYNREEKRVDSAGTAFCERTALSVIPCVMGLLLGANDYDRDNLRREESDVSPKLVLQYFSDHDVNYYASWAKGFKSGGFNSLSYTGDDLEYEAEETQTVEAGIKGRFFNRTLQANLTLYHTQFDNLQVLAFNGTFFDVSNAASAYSRGVEADFLWLTPWAPLELMGSFGWLDARYKDYRDAPAPIQQGIDAEQDLSDQRIAFAPRATATLTPTLTFPLGSMVLISAVDVLYQGDQFVDSDLDPNTYVPAYTKYAARITLGSQSERWSITLGGTNLTDERVLNQVTDTPFFPGTYQSQLASGRQLFAALNLQF